MKHRHTGGDAAARNSSCRSFLVHCHEELEHPPRHRDEVCADLDPRCAARSLSIPFLFSLRVSRLQLLAGRAATGSAEATAMGSMQWKGWRSMGKLGIDY
jgi:hypothetical protein